MLAIVACWQTFFERVWATNLKTINIRFIIHTSMSYPLKTQLQLQVGIAHFLFLHWFASPNHSWICLRCPPCPHCKHIATSPWFFALQIEQNECTIESLLFCMWTLKSVPFFFLPRDFEDFNSDGTAGPPVCAFSLGSIRESLSGERITLGLFRWFW